MNKSIITCAQLKDKRDLQLHSLSSCLGQELQVGIQRPLSRAFFMYVCLLEWINLYQT